VRESAQGLTEQIILQGNEYSPGERENENMFVDVYGREGGA
jgi:hypothetical protein